MAGPRIRLRGGPAHDETAPRQLLFGFGTLGGRPGCGGGREQQVLGSQQQQQQQAGEEAQLLLQQQAAGASSTQGAAAQLSAKALAFQRRPAASAAPSARAQGTARPLQAAGQLSAASLRSQQAARRNPFAAAKPAGAAGRWSAQQAAPRKPSIEVDAVMAACDEQQEHHHHPEPQSGGSPAGMLQPELPAAEAAQDVAADAGLPSVHITPAKRSRPGGAPPGPCALSPLPAMVRPGHNKQVGCSCTAPVLPSCKAALVRRQVMCCWLHVASVLQCIYDAARVPGTAVPLPSSQALLPAAGCRHTARHLWRQRPCTGQQHAVSCSRLAAGRG
jgi:hypothetical protein